MSMIAFAWGASMFAIGLDVRGRVRCGDRARSMRDREREAAFIAVGNGDNDPMRLLLVLAAAGAVGCGGASAPSPPRSAGARGRDAADGLPAIRGSAGQIRLRTLDGRPTTLAAYGAQVTVIALWASYCGPCLDELPHVEALHRLYRDRPEVSVIAVNVEDTREPAMRGELRGLLAQLSVRDTPCLLDGEPVLQQLTTRDELGLPRMALPLLVVVDPAFRLHRRFGFRRGTTREEYLADKVALIEGALRGDEPDDSPPAIF